MYTEILQLLSPILDIDIRKSSATYVLPDNINWIIPSTTRNQKINIQTLKQELSNSYLAKYVTSNETDFCVTLSIARQKQNYEKLINFTNSKFSLLQALLISTQILKSYWCVKTKEIMIITDLDPPIQALYLRFGQEEIIIDLEEIDCNMELAKGDCIVLKKSELNM